MPKQSVAEALWQAMRSAIEEEHWFEAEGILWRFLELEPGAPCTAWDTLGYILLNQGDYEGCEHVLRPWHQSADRTFWLNHKIGDALRGQHKTEEAAAFYRQSLVDGSTSHLTFRNLILTLYEANPAQAIAQMEQWESSQEMSEAAKLGCLKAAMDVPGLELGRWLWAKGYADQDCRRRLLEDSCYRLDTNQCMEILGQTKDLSHWEQSLMMILHGMKGKENPAPTATSQAAGGRCH